MPTLKQVGDMTRKHLAAAVDRGALPPADYKVRATNSKTGPAIHVTIGNYGQAISRTWDTDSPEDCNRAADEWHRSGRAASLIAAVDTCVSRDAWTPPVGGVTKLGGLLISASVGARRVIETAAAEASRNAKQAACKHPGSTLDPRSDVATCVVCDAVISRTELFADLMAPSAAAGWTP